MSHRFDHLPETSHVSTWAALRWQWQRRTRRESRHVERRVPVPRVEPDLEALRDPDPSHVSVTWVGHSSFVLRLGGATLLFDPLWSTTIGGFRRNVAPGVPWDELPRVDGLLVSHNHPDHLDRATVRRLPRDTPCLVPANDGRFFRRWRFTDVREHAWWDASEVTGVRATFVPAKHWSQRTPFDRYRSLWGGWLIEHAGRTVVAIGDTAATPRLREIGERFPRADVALLPIGAYEPRWFMSELHVSPEEATDAFVALGARAMVPHHWGTFPSGDEPLDVPPERLRAAWRERGLDPDALHVLAIGETWRLPGDARGSGKAPGPAREKS